MSLHERIEAQAAARVKFLAALVAQASDNPPGDCAAHAALTAQLLEGLGFAVERHVVPAALAQAQGMISATNLIIRHRFGPGPVIALNAHGDVVPPGEGWTQNPYGAAIVDGWMYGRGVAVSKSDICSYAFAMLALRNSGLDLRGTVELHITYDEETGGEIGPAWLLAQGLTKPDYAIAAGFSYGVVTAHNGCLHLEVTVAGKSAHAAKPETGIDALAAATGILVRLYAERELLRTKISAYAGIGAPALTVGLISGGINTNVVPDKISLRLDRRITPDEEAGTVETELRRLIAQAVAQTPGARAEIKRILLAEPLTPAPGVEHLAAIVCKTASAVFGEPIGTTAVPLYTDARHYAGANIPVLLYGAGPRSIEEANAHRADERLALADLHRATAVIAISLAEMLGGESGHESLLRRAFVVAQAAKTAGCHPFGALLAGPDGEVLMEQQNAYLPEHDMTGHAERVLATRAGKQYGAAFLRRCTLYSSAEPCAMCAGAIYWAGIGRVVYGMSERDLKQLTGNHDENPTLDLPCRVVFAAGQRAVEVIGPLLAEEAKALHEGAWAQASP